MIPTTLAFLTTYKCNFYCDHCSVSCGPKRNEVISWEQMKMAIDQACDIASIRLIVFTGGESSLYRRLLIDGITYVAQKGLMTRVVTNGWWASTSQNTKKVLKEWVDAGLNEINISYDDYHLEYLEKYGGEQNILNIVKAADELNITALIGTVINPKGKIRTNYLREKMINAGFLGKIEYLEDFLFALGRAREKLPKESFYLADEELKKKGCRDAGKTLVVLPTGEITFCCGHLLNASSQKLITLGKIGEKETLSTMVSRMQRNALYWWLYLRGPADVAKKVGINELEHRSCEICHIIATQYMDKLLALADNKEDIFSNLLEIPAS